MQLVYQQWVIVIIYWDGYYCWVVDVYCCVQGWFQCFGVFYGKFFCVEGFGIGFKIYWFEFDVGQVLIFFFFLDSDYVVVVIDLDKMQYVGFQVDGGFQFYV